MVTSSRELLSLHTQAQNRGLEVNMRYDFRLVCGVCLRQAAEDKIIQLIARVEHTCRSASKHIIW
jgi:hypothetical protein